MSRYSQEFKLSALSRLAKAKDVSALARELGVKRLQLYRWQWAFERGGAVALQRVERSAVAARTLPSAATLAGAQERVRALERRLGEQQLELDFFRRALRQVEALRRPSDGPGAPASTPSSRRWRGGKAD
jgi:transposase-like protein